MYNICSAYDIKLENFIFHVKINKKLTLLRLKLNFENDIACDHVTNL